MATKKILIIGSTGAGKHSINICAKVNREIIIYTPRIVKNFITEIRIKDLDINMVIPKYIYDTPRKYIGSVSANLKKGGRNQKKATPLN